MQTKATACLLAIVLLMAPVCLPPRTAAYELPQKPGEPIMTLDLRHTNAAYNQDWIERAHAIYVDRHSGALDPAYIYLTVAIVGILAFIIRLSARLNGLDRHLRTFSGDQFQTALRLWMLRRWGARA